MSSDLALAEAINSVLRTPTDYGVQVAAILTPREKRVVTAFRGHPFDVDLFVSMIRARRLEQADAQLRTALQLYARQVEEADIESRSHHQRIDILSQLGGAHRD